MSRITVKEFLETDIPRLYAGDPILKIAETFANCPYNFLPVYDTQNNFRGLVTIDSLINAFTPSYLALFPRLDLIPDFGILEGEFLTLSTSLFVAEDLIDHEILRVDENDSLLKAVVQMIQEKCDQLPVFSRDNFVGIIRKNSLAKAVVSRSR